MSANQLSRMAQGCGLDEDLFGGSKGHVQRRHPHKGPIQAAGGLHVAAQREHVLRWS